MKKVVVKKNRYVDSVSLMAVGDKVTQLDGIENGDSTMEQVLGDFYVGFKQSLEKAETNLSAGNIEIPAEETDIICDKCGSRMIIKNGRFGRFAACPNYPTCKNTKPLNKEADDSENKEKKQIVSFSVSQIFNQRQSLTS